MLPTGQLQPMGQHLVSECRQLDFYDIRDSDTTCLHAALTPGDFFDTDRLDRTKVLTRIISIVPKEMFITRDSQGRTPLHIAVHYESCSMVSQVEIVKLLLDRGPEALNCETKLDSGQPISVYQYHEASKRLGEDRYNLRKREFKEQEQQRLKRQREQHQQPYRDTSGTERIQVDSKSFGKGQKDAKQIDPRLRGSMEPPLAYPVPISRPDANVSSRRDSMVITTPSTHDAPQLPSAPNKLWGTSSQAGVSPRMTAQASSDVKRMVTNDIDQERRREASAAISEQLKLLCLRTRQPDRAARFLRTLDGKEGNLDKT